MGREVGWAVVLRNVSLFEGRIRARLWLGGL